MDRLSSNRLFRCLVCLILVCCLVFTWATVPVRASVSVTTMYGLGLAALLLLGACGVVFNPTSTAHIEAIGQSWSDYMYASAQTDEEVEIIDVTFGLVFDEITDPPEDPRISSGLWSAFFVGKALEWVERFLSADSSITISESLDRSYSIYSYIFADFPFGMCTLTSEKFYYVVWYATSPGRINLDTDFDSSYIPSGITISASYGSPYRGVYFSGSYGNISDWESVKDSVYAGWPYLGYFDSSLLSSYDYGNYSNGFCRYIIANMSESLSYSTFYGKGLSSEEKILPDLITGGIKTAVDDGYDIQDITLPDLEYGNIITEDQTLEEAITQTQTQLIDGTMTWEQYVDLLTNGNGINITINNGGGTSNDYPINNDGVSSTPLTPTELAPYVVDLRDFFPFCIPFDLYDFFSLLAAEPEAPVFHWEIQDLAGNIYPIDIDLSSWDTFALVFRKMQLLVFVIGLAMASRKFIKW